MKRLFIFFALAVVTFSSALVYAKITGEDKFFRDVRPAHWSWNGSDLETIYGVFDTLKTAEGPREPSGYIDTVKKYGPGNWTYEFEKLGDTFVERAKEQAALGLDGNAAFYYSKAAGYYGMAKYPHTRGAKHANRAYAKNIEAVQKSWEASGKPFEHIKMTFEGKPVDGLLHMPEGPAPEEGWPLVLAINGLDVFKGEFFSLPHDLTDQGIAFFAMDLMGSGSHGAFALTPDNDRLVSFFMDRLSERSDINADALGFMGVSFGGNTAARLAFTEQERLKAVVNMCGPIHQVFMLEGEDVQHILPMYIEGVRDRMKIENKTDEELAAHVKDFSLINQGLIGEGKPKTVVPILSINAREDYVAPKFDMDLINASTENGRIIYSGADDHCPQDRFTVMPQVVSFFEANLTRAKQLN